LLQRGRERLAFLFRWNGHRPKAGGKAREQANGTLTPVSSP
jgi:hypothetical protein